MTYEFATRTGTVRIDHSRCAWCPTAACIHACARYGVGILALEGGKPVLNVPLDEARRRDNECLACELACRLHGHAAITIVLPIPGLDEYVDTYVERYRRRHGHPAG